MGPNDASKGQQVAIRAYCFELLIANSCDRPAEPGSAASLLSYPVIVAVAEIVAPYKYSPPTSQRLSRCPSYRSIDRLISNSSLPLGLTRKYPRLKVHMTVDA